MKLQKKIFFSLLIFYSLFIRKNYSTVFLNKYLVPEIGKPPLSYHEDHISNLSLYPFIMTTAEGTQKDLSKRPALYEIDGPLSIEALQVNSMASSENRTNNSLALPTEWIASHYAIPLTLKGNLEATGLGWNFFYTMTPYLTAGWSSGLAKVVGVLNYSPKENPQKYQLKESMMLEINRIFNTLTTNMGLQKNYSQYLSFCDQDFYITLNFSRDYLFYMKKIQSKLRVGCIAPTAQEINPNNPASIPLGSNGFPSLYSGLSIDLLLKEDIALSFEGKAFYLFPQTKTIRQSMFVESNGYQRFLTSSRYGSFTGRVGIEPGYIYQLAPTLTVEGLRRGLGCKVGYSTWGQTPSNYNFPPAEVNDQIVSDVEAASSWNQEHCLVSLFYDFGRENNINRRDILLSFSSEIPVEFFFAHNSARSLSLSFLFEYKY
jgi:hypothetical protein